ncbi:MAG: hypothetical protein IJI58_00480 [Bacilli bacterium]|nr:hypothetical protein [Bacilli bacterium]
MDKLSTFNNEELLEVYAKVQEEINHLNECILEEEPDVEAEEEKNEEVSETEKTEESSEEEKTEEEKEEKEEENNEQS